MNNKRLLYIIGELDDRYIADAAPGAKRGRRPVWVKLAAAAACLALLLAAGIAIYRAGDASPVLIGGVRREYGRARVIGGDEAEIEWPWEYKTPAERYTSLTLDGREYVSTGRAVDGSLTGRALGVYDVEGYDPYTEETHRLRAEVFESGGICAGSSQR